MGVYDQEDVLGASIGEKVVCLDCLTAEENNALKEKELILESNIHGEGQLYFCDRCGKKL